MKCPSCRSISNNLITVYNGNPECEICFETDKEFKMFPCGHMYCKTCIEQYEESRIEDDISNIEDTNDINFIPITQRGIFVQDNGIIKKTIWVKESNEWVLYEVDLNDNPTIYYQGGSYSNHPFAPIGWYVEWVNTKFPSRWRLIKKPPIILPFYYFGKIVHWRIDIELNIIVLFQQDELSNTWSRFTTGSINNRPYAPQGWFPYWCKKKNLWTLRIFDSRIR